MLCITFLFLGEVMQTEVSGTTTNTVLENDGTSKNILQRAMSRLATLLKQKLVLKAPLRTFSEASYHVLAAGGDGGTAEQGDCMIPSSPPL